MCRTAYNIKSNCFPELGMLLGRRLAQDRAKSMDGDGGGERFSKFADSDGQRAQIFVNIHNGDCFAIQPKYNIIISLKGINNDLDNWRVHKSAISVI